VKQVRIDDDIADWLSGQGGSISAAANRTLAWARDAIEAMEDDEIVEPEPARVPAGPVDGPVDEVGQNGHAPRAGKASTSSGRGRRARFSPIIRRPGY
jgi:hypothetical protein